MHLVQELFLRNPYLSIYGALCLLGAMVCLALVHVTEVEILGINAFVKPLKFFLSIGAFSLTMAWFTGHLPEKNQVAIYSWVVILVMTFELVYITYQAGRGETSHFNNSTSFHSMMWGLMGIAISVATLWTAYIGILFFKNDFPGLSITYVWGIRIGIILFVIFAFEGGVMGAKLAHTVGGPDGKAGLAFTNWSIRHGDLRVAHFFGMHALQVIPLAGYYVFSQPRDILIFSGIYLFLVVILLVQALMGLPLIRL